MEKDQPKQTVREVVEPDFSLCPRQKREGKCTRKNDPKSKFWMTEPEAEARKAPAPATCLTT